MNHVSYARLIVPLDVSLVVQSSVPGMREDITVAGRIGKVVLPTIANPEGTLRAPEGFDVVEDFSWGTQVSWGRTIESRQYSVAALGFEFDLHPSEIAIPLGGLGLGYAKGFDSLRADLSHWIVRFTEFGGSILGQPLSLFDPSPKVLSSANNATMQWVQQSDQRSWVDTSGVGPVITISLSDNASPHDERSADVDSLFRVISLASTQPPIIPPAVALLTSARLAAQRRRWRTSIMELGTAAEALLTDILQLGVHKMTLGPLFDIASKRLSLPRDVGARFVRPRNEAVHQAVEPRPIDVDFALELLDALVAQHYPTYYFNEGLPVAHRPQRQDLYIVRPPTTEDPKIQRPDDPKTMEK